MEFLDEIFEVNATAGSDDREMACQRKEPRYW